MRSILLAWTVILSASALAKFETLRFDVTAEIRTERTVKITETITVRFTQPQTGFYRTFPVHSAQIPGRQTEYRDFAAYCDGKRANADVSPQGELIRLIVDPKRTFAADKQHVFRISYVVPEAMTKSPEGMDRFYWNFLPSGWRNSIPAATIRIQNPIARLSYARVFLGPKGSYEGVAVDSRRVPTAAEGRAEAQFNKPGDLTVKLRKPIQPGESLSVMLDFRW